MQIRTADPTRPYAPVPVTQEQTDVILGSWFARHQPAVQAVVVVTAFVAGNYFFWRLFVSGLSTPPWLFWLMICAECMGLLSWLILVNDAWHVESTTRPKPIETTVDILIPCLDINL